MKTNNLLYAVAALLFSQQVIAQTTDNGKHFIIKGDLNGALVDSVSIDYKGAEGIYVHKVAAVTHNKFILTGNISHPVNAGIVFKKAGEVISYAQLEDRTREFFIDPDTLTITGDPLKVKDLVISGSKTNAEFEPLNDRIQAIYAEMKPLKEAFRKEKDHDKAGALHAQFDPYLARVKRLRYQFYLDHPNSYVTLYNMQIDVSGMSLDSVKTVYNSYNDELKATNEGKELAAQITSIEAGLPGHMAFVFTKTDINGKPLSLADFKGKYVMLDFWASWCVPCRKGNPHMIGLYNKYHDKGFDVIGIADDDGANSVWNAAVNKDSVRIWYHVLRGLNRKMKMQGLNNPDDLDDQYAIAAIPTKILIDPSGKIIGRFGDSYGGSDDDMDKMLAAIFNK